MNKSIKLKTKSNKMKMKSKAGVALLTIIVIVVLAFSNILTNKTEAASNDIYDIILFWGQSNMVGSANAGAEKRQGTTAAERKVFSEKTGIDLDIVNNIVSRGEVNVDVPDGCYEFLYDPDTYVNTLKDRYGNNTKWKEMTSANGKVWNMKNLKPLGYDIVVGENLAGNTATGAIQSGVGTHTYFAGTTNMVPEFCSTYYKLTGRKVVAVVCARGGAGIQDFAPTNENGQNNGTYIVMSRKMWAAQAYLQNQGMNIGKCMFVSMQGEQTSGITSADVYVNWYRKVVDQLKIDCGIEKGALCETGGMIWDGARQIVDGYRNWDDIPVLNSSCVDYATVDRIHTAQEKLINNYSDTILGSRFGYDSYIPLNQTEYEQKCTTKASFVPGASTLFMNNRWGFEQAIMQASLRMDYDYGYKPQTSDKTSPLVRNTSADVFYTYQDVNSRTGEVAVRPTYNGIHYTSASLCQIGREAATSLASTFSAGEITVNPSSITVQVGNTGSVGIQKNTSGGTVTAASEDPSIASIDTSVLANSSDASLVSTKTPVEIKGITIKVKGNKAGTTRIWVTSAPTGVYKQASTYFDVTVNKKSITIPTLSNTSKTYNGSAQSPTISNPDSAYVNQSGTVSTIAAGTHKITWTLKDTTNTQWSDGTTSQKSDTWTIAKRSVTIPTLTNTSKTYNGSTQSPTVNNLDTNYVNQGGTGSSINPGTYVITWNLKDANNCTWSDGTTGTKSATWSIGNASGLEVSAEGYENTYDGAAHGITVTCSGATITYGTTNGTYNLSSSPTYTDAGTYTVYYKVSKNGYNDVTGSRTVKINPKSVTIPTLSSVSKTYNGSAQGPTISNPDSTYINQSGDASATNAGTYTVNWNLKDTKNYIWSDSTTTQKSANWTIARRSVTIPSLTNISKTYNESVQGPTISNPDSAFINQSGATTATNPGTYTINWNLKDTANYQWSDGTTSQKSATWSIANSDGLKVTVTGYENTYDGAAHGITVTCSGATITYGTTNGTYNLSSSPTYTDAGTYTVYYKVTKNGYNPVTGSAIVKISQKSISGIALSLNQSNYTYDGSAKQPTPTVVDGTTALKNGTHYTVAYSNNVNAGTATVTITGKGNYTGQKSTTFTIEKATPKITLSKTTETINVDDTTTFTASVTQGAGALSVSSSAESVATATISNGTITVISKSEGLANITVTSAVSDNYKSTSAVFALVVEKGVLKVTATGYQGTYDGSAHGIAVTCSGAAIKYGTSRDTCNLSSSPTYTDAGTYTVYYKASKSGYNDVIGSQIVQIGKRTITVTANSLTKKYGEENPELSCECSGYISGQTPKFTGSVTTTATKTSSVGVYDIVSNNLALTDNGTFKAANYNLSFVKGTLTIVKAKGSIELTGKDNQTTIIVKQSKDLQVNATGEISATSSNSNVATVKVNNKTVSVTGVTPGEAKITITSAATTNYEAAQLTYTVGVVANSITSLQIKQVPKTSYIEGQELDVTGGKLTITYLDGTTTEIALTKDMVSGFNANRIGEQVLTITYGGKKITYTVVVRQKQTTRIEVQSMPTKTVYIQNYETLDLAGAKVKVTYDNGTTETLNVTEDMVTGFDNSKVGVNTITISYQGKSCDVNLRIVEKSITKIEIAKLPNMLSYVKDYGILDVTGGKIKVKFDDNTETLVDMTKEMVTGFDNTNIGTQTLVVEYANNRTEYEVEVIDAVITKIVMQALPTKTTYIQNYETLDLTGAKLAITFNDSITNTINVLEEMVSGFDNTKVGQNTITVRYAEKEATFNVEIIKHSVVKIEIDKKPNKTEYKQGEKLDLTGGKIKIYYNDETSEVVDMDITMLNGNSELTTVGSKLITLKVENQEVGFEVSVATVEKEKDENNNNNSDNEENNNNNGNSNTNNESQGNSNNEKTTQKNQNNGSNQDATIATKDIPQTGVNPGVVIAMTILTAIGGFTAVKAFKYRFIK